MNFGVLIVNSLDHISHEIDSELMKNEILNSEKKYRAFTEQWFKNSERSFKKTSKSGIDQFANRSCSHHATNQMKLKEIRVLIPMLAIK